MATGFIEKFRHYCGGSRALAWLLTITVGTGLLVWLSGIVCHLSGWNGNGIADWLSLPADFGRFLTRPWTIATYMLVHFSPLHLIFNILWLYWFGRMLADTQRDGTIITLFAGGGIAGGILYMIASTLTLRSSAAYLTGDSAAVLSVMTATALLMPSRRIGLFLIGEVKLKWVAIVCIALTLIGSGGGTAPQAAHIGGILFGLGWWAWRRGYIRLPERGHQSRQAPRKINAKATIKAINRSLTDHERLDQLLDKVRVSGYDSLSKKEKAELNYISQHLEE